MASAAVDRGSAARDDGPKSPGARSGNTVRHVVGPVGEPRRGGDHSLVCSILAGGVCPRGRGGCWHGTRSRPLRALGAVTGTTSQGDGGKILGGSHLGLLGIVFMDESVDGAWRGGGGGRR